MNGEIEKSTNTMLKISIAMMIFLILFISGALISGALGIIPRITSDPSIIFMCILALGVGSVGLITLTLLLYRKKIKSEKGIIARFVRDQKAFESGQWYKNNMIPIACVLSLFFLLFVLWIGIVEKSVAGTLIFLFLGIFVSGFTFFGGFKRRGWEFKRIDKLIPEEILNILSKTFKDSNIKFIETKENKAFIGCTSCRTFSLGDTGLLLSILGVNSFSLLAIGRINAQNLDKAKKIQEIIDSNLINSNSIVGKTTTATKKTAYNRLSVIRKIMLFGLVGFIVFIIPIVFIGLIWSGVRSWKIYLIVGVTVCGLLMMNGGIIKYLDRIRVKFISGKISEKEQDKIVTGLFIKFAILSMLFCAIAVFCFMMSI